jgi:hypothetical protein
VFISALRPAIRRACASQPDGKEWTSLHELIQRATLTEANLVALPYDTGGASSAVAATGAGAPSAGRGNSGTKRRNGGTSSGSNAKKPRGTGYGGGMGRNHGNGRGNGTAAGPPGSDPNQMLVWGVTRAAATVRRNAGECLYCGRHGHMWGPACPSVADGLAGRRSPRVTPRSGA